MRGRTFRTPEKRQRFLDALAEGASVTAACQCLKIGRHTVYDWRASDAAFAKAWDAAIDIGTDALEDESVRRGKDGVKRPVYQGGKLAGYVQEYLDTLLMVTLKARPPEKFRDNAHASLSGGLKLEQLVAEADKLRFQKTER